MSITMYRPNPDMARETIIDPQPPSGPRRIIGWLAAATAALLFLSGLLTGLVLAPDTPRAEPTFITVPQQSTPSDAGSGVIAEVAASVAPAVVQLERDGGVGSGVIYDASGLILTAAHVVDGAGTVDVRLADGRLLDGEVLGAHTTTDIAVVKVSAEGLPTAQLGYGTPTRVGETAIALGSPFGLDQTVTSGIVSATGRAVNGIPMVQTDAAINPGNSGGPLVNSSGQVIGINDVIFTEGGGNDGIGFAVSIDIAIVVADQIVAGEPVQLAILGAATIPNTDGSGGAIVREVIPDSPAATAGLGVGDRIVSVDNVLVADPTSLFTMIISNRPGALVHVEYVRDGVVRGATVELGGVER